MTGPHDDDAAQQPTTPLEPLPIPPTDDVMGAPPAGSGPPPTSGPGEPGDPSASGTSGGPSRPPWLGWAVGAAVVVAAIVGFFGAKAIAGHGNSTNAVNINTNGTLPSNGNQNGENGGGFFGGGNGGPNGRNFGPGAAGTIASINGSNLTINDRRTNATQKVTTSSSTRVIIDKTASISDIAKGDRVIVTGTTSGTTITATNVNDSGTQGAFGFRRNAQNGDGTPPEGAPGSAPGNGGNGGGFFGGANGGNGGSAGNGNGGRFANGNFAAGTVKSVSGNNIVITTRDGSTMTVATTSSTKFTKTATGSVSDLKTGDNVVVIGTQASDGSIAATTISEGRGFGGFGGGFRGGAGGGNGNAGGGPVA